MNYNEQEEGLILTSVSFYLTELENELAESGEEDYFTQQRIEELKELRKKIVLKYTKNL